MGWDGVLMMEVCVGQPAKHWSFGILMFSLDSHEEFRSQMAEGSHSNATRNGNVPTVTRGWRSSNWNPKGPECLVILSSKSQRTEEQGLTHQKVGAKLPLGTTTHE